MEVGTVEQMSIPISGFNLTVNHVTIIMMFITMGILVGLAYLFSKNLKNRPNRKQSLIEVIIEGFDNIVVDTMGEEGRKFFPLVMTLFLYIAVSNWLGMIPFLKSPTEDLNTCIAMALMIFLLSHIVAIKKKGLKQYLKGYCEPFIFMFPLNIIGEMGKTLSHCFRLFGNIFGGGIIFALVAFIIFKIAPSLPFPFLRDISDITSFGAMNAGELITYIACAPAVVIVYFICFAFFGLFAGTIQALVFTLLALTYIAELSE